MEFSNNLEKRKEFSCNLCGLSMPYSSFGRTSKFSKSLVLLEDCYVGRDPFSTTPKPIILGSHCTVCDKIVCVSASCSIFYTKRFCIKCFQNNIDEFPVEIQKEYSKTLNLPGKER